MEDRNIKALLSQLDRMGAIKEEESHKIEYLEDYDPFAAFMPTKPIRRETPKIGRNKKCPCGSGKKYKKCCL